MEFLSPDKLERLCSLVYLDELLNYSGDTPLGVISNDMIRGIKHETPAGMISKTDFFSVLRDIIADRELSKLFMVDFYDVPLDYPKPDKTPGNRIVVFSDGGGNGAVVFRGTHGDAEWADNGRRMYSTDTRELFDCADFVNKTAARFAFNYIVTAGHSGGGNKAMYCYLTCKMRGDYTVDECFSLDGQGFSVEFKKKYGADLNARGADIVEYAERRDFVNCLGFYASTPPLYFSGKRGDTLLPEFPFGAPLPWFHLPDSLRNDDNQILDQAEKAYISEAINALVTFVLTDPDYRDKKQFLCDTLVTLMMTETKTNKFKQADAIAIMIAAALEISSTDSRFAALIKDVIKNEKRVIIATAIMLFGDITKWGESDMVKLVREAYKKHSAEEFCRCDDNCKNEISTALYSCDEHFKLFIPTVG
jgi:hypothetical protein